MKMSEIRGLPASELSQKLSELKKELMKANAQIAVGTALANPGKVRVIKRTIARITSHLATPVSAQKSPSKVASPKRSEQSNAKPTQSPLKKSDQAKPGKEGSSPKN